MFTKSFLLDLIDEVDCCPWGVTAGRSVPSRAVPARAVMRSVVARPLYTPDQRRRRDASVWTTVQGFLAPIQFIVFAISLGLVVHYLVSGQGLRAATVSILAKTLALYTIMLTGAIWERDAFGRYLFAPSFFWEDVFSLVVLALHTVYVAALLTGALGAREQMLLALAAYAAYIINAAQFALKLRLARREPRPWPAEAASALGAGE